MEFCTWRPAVCAECGSYEFEIDYCDVGLTVSCAQCGKTIGFVLICDNKVLEKGK